MKYFQAGLVQTSAGRGWTAISAELRSHSDGLIVERKASPDAEVAIAVGASTEAIVHRRTGKHLDNSRTVHGTVWVCPAGVSEEVQGQGDTPEILHLWIPKSTFDHLKDDSLHGRDPSEYVTYKDGHADPLIAQCGLAIAQELRQQTSTGKLLVESIAITIVARLVHSNAGTVVDGELAAIRSGLDAKRLLRVLEAIDAGLEEDLSIAYLAEIACLSPFHFARAFKTSMGMSPHLYVSTRRLHRAKDLVASGEIPLSQIAVSLGFSTQANFNRAFKSATGVTPTAYKKSIGK